MNGIRGYKIGNYFLSLVMLVGGIITTPGLFLLMGASILFIIPLEPVLAKKFKIGFLPKNIKESAFYNLAEAIPFIVGNIITSIIYLRGS